MTTGTGRRSGTSSSRCFPPGETYAFAPDITEDEARKIWIETPSATFAAFDDKDDAAPILGTYFIKPNQQGPGSHVCNCGFIVDKKARGKGVASAMCGHSQKTAVSMGFFAMQFNMVVSTNKVAVALWAKHGFEIVGVLPKAFNHKQLGFVDAYVMYKQLAA